MLEQMIIDADLCIKLGSSDKKKSIGVRPTHLTFAAT